jgi:hypothetical protein
LFTIDNNDYELKLMQQQLLQQPGNFEVSKADTGSVLTVYQSLMPMYNQQRVI